MFCMIFAWGGEIPLVFPGAVQRPSQETLFFYTGAVGIICESYLDKSLHRRFDGPCVKNRGSWDGPWTAPGETHSFFTTLCESPTKNGSFQKPPWTAPGKTRGISQPNSNLLDHLRISCKKWEFRKEAPEGPCDAQGFPTFRVNLMENFRFK
jgi:hypothetical protein